MDVEPCMAWIPILKKSTPKKNPPKQSYECNWCKKFFNCKDHFEKHTCCSTATTQISVQKKNTALFDFLEKTTFNLEKPYEVCMLNDFQESSLSLSGLSIKFALKGVI